MIQLNRIFGRRTTESQSALTGPTPQPAFVPPGVEEEWDEDSADAYLLAQEQLLTKATPDPPLMAEVAQPMPVESVADISLVQDRAAMARQQLAAAQAPAVAIAVPIDLSGPIGSDAGQIGRRVGRVKTRLLGFDHAPALTQDPIEAARSTAPATVQGSFPVGWIVVIRGPGRGAHFTLYNGVSQIGRGDDQAIKLDFGDGSISRTNHAAIAYDDETKGFFLGHGGKTNMVRLNNRPVISTETLSSDDMIRIGETTLLFVALCGDGFCWTSDQTGPDDFG